MNNFFTFYKDIEHVHTPIISFSIAHLLLLIFVGLLGVILFKKYQSADAEHREVYLKRFAIYFFVEEMVYSLWLIIVCKHNVILELMPLELCSLCCYMNIASVIFKKDYLRFFSGLIGILAGVFALAYPANIAGLYPVISYRTINFFVLHMMFILFGVIQFYEYKMYEYKYLKKNILIVAGMFTFAFCFNLIFKTQYMMVGMPPKIGVIALIYKTCGFVLFLPVAIIIVSFLQTGLFYIIRIINRKLAG